MTSALIQQEIISQWHQGGGAGPPASLLIHQDQWSFEIATNKGAPVTYDLGEETKNKVNHKSGK